MISAFGDSDDEDIQQDSEPREEPDHDIMHRSPLRPPPPPQRPLPPAAASGDGLQNIGMRGMGQGAVVQWNEDGSHVRPCPHSSHYEAARGECGAHLLFNAFWTVVNCCVHQLLMKDSMPWCYRLPHNGHSQKILGRCLAVVGR